MKKFAGNRPLADIIAAAREQGVAVDDYNWRVNGADRIAFGVADKHLRRPDGSQFVRTAGTGKGWVLYSGFNGTFWGQTERGIKFDSSSTRHERAPWFQALLAFFYVPKDSGETVTPPAATMVDYTLGGHRVLPGLLSSRNVDSSDGCAT